jgi:hypothetical protein
MTHPDILTDCIQILTDADVSRDDYDDRFRDN